MKSVSYYNCKSLIKSDDVREDVILARPTNQKNGRHERQGLTNRWVQPDLIRTQAAGVCGESQALSVALYRHLVLA